MSQSETRDKEQFTRELENTFLKDVLKDRRDQRRLGYLKLGLFIVIAGVVLSANLFGFGPFQKGLSIPWGEKYVSVVRISGSISAGSPASAEFMEAQLYKAFFDKKSSGVVLLINSPGGTAVQGALLHDLILEYKHESKKRVLAFGEDYLASGAYMAALAADTIYATPSTITGSIGVKQDHYNLGDFFQKAGVHATTFHAGEHKNRMSMFGKPSEADIEKVKATTEQIHMGFINLVKKARKGKIDEANHVLFTGDFWLGDEAKKLGLIDGVDSINAAIKTEFGVKYKIDYSDKSTVNGFRKLVASAQKVMTDVSILLPKSEY